MKRNKISFFYSFVLILLTILSNNCIMDKVNISEGVTHYQNREYEKSIAYFENKLKENPNNTEIRTQLFRSKLKVYFQYLTQARKYKKFKKKKEALLSYSKALTIFPENFSLNQEINDYKNLEQKSKKSFVSSIEPPVRLSVDPKEEIEKINLKAVPITKIYKAVGDTFDINFIFDKDFKDFIYSLDVKKTGFYELLDQLCMISNSEYRILNKSSILIYPNQTYKKKQFELKGVKVFYLQNTKAEDAKKLLMTLFRDQRIIVQDDVVSNTLIVKASYLTLKEIERFLAKIDKPKSEVAIDIEILEVNRDIISKLGADFGTSVSAGLSAGADDGTGTFSSSMNFNNIKNTNFFITLPTAAMTFLESNTNSKILAKPNLRGVNDEKIEFKIGEKIPIPKTTFAAAAAGGISNVPMTNYDYRDVGIRIEITPFIHNNGDISMQLDLKMDFISTYIDQFPVLGNRELKSFLRLKEGETSIIGGFIKDEVRKSLKGLPVIARIPILGKLFALNDDRITQTDVIFSITPRVIRKVNVSETDNTTVWSNIKTISNNNKSLPRRGNVNTPTRRSTNRLVVSPSKRRMAVGKSAIFTLRFNSKEDIESLNMTGSIDGGRVEIENIRTSFFQKSKEVSVFDNVSGNSFTLGYTFQKKNMKGSTLAQIKVKFLEKGEYKINFGSINCTTKNKSTVSMDGNTATIEVKWIKTRQVGK